MEACCSQKEEREDAEQKGEARSEGVKLQMRPVTWSQRDRWWANGVSDALTFGGGVFGHLWSACVCLGGGGGGTRGEEVGALTLHLSFFPKSKTFTLIFPSSARFKFCTIVGQALPF